MLRAAEKEAMSARTHFPPSQTSNRQQKKLFRSPIYAKILFKFHSEGDALESQSVSQPKRERVAYSTNTIVDLLNEIDKFKCYASTKYKRQVNNLKTQVAIKTKQAKTGIVQTKPETGSNPNQQKQV